jgi:hypothetical protein
MYNRRIAEVHQNVKLFIFQSDLFMTNNFMPNLTRMDEKRLRNGWMKSQVTLVVSHTAHP